VIFSDDDERSVTGLLLYTRQSVGNEMSIDQQRSAGKRRSATEAWPVLASFSDTVSASRRAKKTRTDWPLLLDAIPENPGAALWLWESSRGDRKLSSWAQMLELCRDHDVRIYVETDRRLYDMSRLRDWRNLAEDGVDSEAESEKIRMRVLRDTGPRAQAGNVYGKCAYGYLRRYELTGRGRRLLAQEAHPDEAPVVVFIFKSLEAGVSVTALQRALNGGVYRCGDCRALRFPGRGFCADCGSRRVLAGAAACTRARHGKPWSMTTIRNIALNPVYIGKRVHAPGLTHTERNQMGPGVSLYDGKWDGLVSEETFWAVRRILMDPERVTTRPGGARHLLTRFAVCDVCNGALGARYPKRLDRVASLRCRTGHVMIRMDMADEYVEDTLIAYLTLPDVLERLRAASASDDRELSAARADLDAAEAHLLSLRTRLGNGTIEEEDFDVAAPLARKRRDAARARVKSLESPGPLRFLLDGPAEEMYARWRSAPMSARREALRCAAAVRVKTADYGRRMAVEERVSVTFKW